MVRALSDQAKNRLSQEVVKLKEALKAQTEKFDDVNRQLAWLSEERKSSEGNKELKALLKEAQLEVLSAGD